MTVGTSNIVVEAGVLKQVHHRAYLDVVLLDLQEVQLLLELEICRVEIVFLGMLNCARRHTPLQGGESIQGAIINITRCPIGSACVRLNWHRPGHFLSLSLGWKFNSQGSGPRHPPRSLTPPGRRLHLVQSPPCRAKLCACERSCVKRRVTTRSATDEVKSGPILNAQPCSLCEHQQRL